jgi:hypothetical protein
MTAPREWSSAWRQFWFAEIPPHSYALLRILLGVIGVVTIAGAWDRGFWDVGGIMPAEGAWRLGSWLVAHGLGHTAGVALRLCLLACYACMAAGVASTIAVPAAFLAGAGMTWWNWLPFSAAQALHHDLIFCLIFADTGAVWSFDAWRRSRQSGAKPPVPEVVWPLRLVQCQLALVYLSAALWKLANPEWRSGLALHYVLNGATYRRTPWFLPAELFGGTVLLTYFTLFWELTFPVLIWSRLRPVVLWCGVALHVGMWMTMEVGVFSPTILAAYVAFLDPWRTEARVRGWFGRAPVG